MCEKEERESLPDWTKPYNSIQRKRRNKIDLVKLDAVNIVLLKLVYVLKRNRKQKVGVKNVTFSLL